jgi:hypothetical protein
MVREEAPAPEMDAPEMDAPEMDAPEMDAPGGASEPAVVEEPGAERL